MSARWSNPFLLHRIKRVFTRIFSSPVAPTSPLSVPPTDTAMSGVQHAELVSALEQELGVRFSPEEIEHFGVITSVINGKIHHERTPAVTDGAESIVIICPDTHITLWPNRLAEAATGGGKSAILRLAMGWARAGHPVTIAGAAVVEGEIDGVTIRELSRAAGRYDIAIYVTGLLGHFEHPAIKHIRADVRLLWQNPPAKVAFPPGEPPDWIIVPARFLAQRGACEWGYPPERIVVIPGEGVSQRLDPCSTVARDEMAVV